MVINWDNIEALLYEYYEVGKSKEGADAYPPLMLLPPAGRDYTPESFQPGGLPARREGFIITEVSTTWRAELGMGLASGLEGTPARKG